MALHSLSGSRCVLWRALQMSWPQPARFGSPAPAAAKSGNEVNERVVLGHFPLISTQLRSDSGSDLRHRTFQCPPASWGSGARAAGDEHVGARGVERGSILEGAWGVGAEGSSNNCIPPASSPGRSRGDARWAGAGLQPEGVGPRREGKLAEHLGRGLIGAPLWPASISALQEGTKPTS